MPRVYKCRNGDCKWEQPTRWTGQCPNCFGYFAIYETNAYDDSNGMPTPIVEGVPVSLQDAVNMEQKMPEVLRLETEIEGIDHVLGGGIVPGSLTLLCGDPGAGKTTALIQVMQALARRRHTVLYVTGEESVSQLASRYKGLGRFPERLQALQETDIDAILDNIDELKPEVVVIDSIQRIEVDEDLETGSASTIKAAIDTFMRFAKQERIAFIIVGHVTKGGSIGGPRALEHMVDVSLHLAGNPASKKRTLHCYAKNRFAGTAGTPVKAFFEMTSAGLVKYEEPPSNTGPTEEEIEAAKTVLAKIPVTPDPGQKSEAKPVPVDTVDSIHKMLGIPPKLTSVPLEPEDDPPPAA